MSDFDDEIGLMVADLLVEAGESFTYWRGTTSTTITLAKSVMPSTWVDQGDGHVIEVRPINFKCLTSALPYAIPLQGDRITDGTSVYELHPTTSEKVYRQLSPLMTRLHAKQVK